MTRPCDVCGEPYEAQRKASRFCSDTCRKRAQRAPDSAVSNDPAPTDGALLAAVRQELEDADRLDTPLGQVALVLATHIGSPMGSGSSRASMSRELRAVLAEAMADQKDKGVPARPQRETKGRRQRLLKAVGDGHQ